MKKCPKCGTILDDSKKKCYMCGTSLTLSNSVSDFSANFNDEIGSSVTKAADNVFNNGEDINVNSKDIVDGEINNNGSFFSHNSSSRDYFGGEINKLNSEGVKKEGRFAKRKEEKTKDKFFGKPKEIPQNKERIPQDMLDSIIEKNNEQQQKKFAQPEILEEAKVIKSNIVQEEKKKEEALPDAFKGFNSYNDEKTLEKTKELKKSNNFFSFGSDNKNDGNSIYDVPKDKGNSNDFFSADSNKQNSIYTNNNNINENNNNFSSAFSFYNENKKDDNRNNMHEKEKNSNLGQQDFSKMKEKRNVDWGSNVKRNLNRTKTDIKETGRAIFNITCTVIFVGLMIFVYFKFFRADKYEQIMGLKYRIPATFKLAMSSSESKYYESEKLGNECSIRVMVGATQGDSYEESFFRYVRNIYAQESEDATSTHESIKINGNLWQSEKVIFLPKDSKNVNYENIIPRYNYTLMIYNGAFYNINYTNIKEDSDCHKDLKNIMYSVEFVDKNVKNSK